MSLTTIERILLVTCAILEALAKLLESHPELKSDGEAR